MQHIDLLIFALATIGIGVGVYASSAKPSAMPNILVISASDLHGGYFDADFNLRRVSPTPAEQIAALSGLRCVDETINGLQLCEVLTGGNLRFAADANHATTRSLKELLEAHPDCQIVYLGLGLNDVLFGGRTLTQLLSDLEAALHIIVCAGRVPVLRGYHNFAPSPMMTAEKIGIAKMAGLAVLIKARDFGVAVVDVASVPCGGMAADGLHPDDAYHGRLCEYQASELLRICSKCV